MPTVARQSSFSMLTANYWLLFVLLEGMKHAAVAEKDQTTCASDTKKHSPTLFLYPPGYETNDVPPAESGDGPFSLNITMDVWEISEVSLARQDIGVDLILEIQWQDLRLSVNPNISSPRLWHVITDEELPRIWKPTLAFRNCKGCHLITLKPPFYMRKSDGVLWVQHRSVTYFSCPIDLRAYPMDNQVCVLQLFTNVDYDNHIVLKHATMDDQLAVSSNMTLSEFIIPPMKKGFCNFMDANEGGGEYFSCIEIKIQFNRLMTYHFMTSYIPTTFIVIISWISFWIPVDVVPARIALGLTLLLTIATRLDQAQKNLPSVSYAKALDVWIFACICMVCASLLEFATSYYIWRINQMCNVKSSVDKHKDCAVSQVRPVTTSKTSSVSQKPQKEKKQRDGTPLDRASRVLFPLFFLIFNICYWCSYL